MAFNTHQNSCYFFCQLVDKLTTDEDIQDVEFDLNDVSKTKYAYSYLFHYITPFPEFIVLLLNFTAQSQQ